MQIPASMTKAYEARELLWNLTLRELRTKYRRSFLGWFWSLLNPISTVVIYSLVFGQLFNATAPVGTNSGISAYAIYLMCGILPWNFFGLVTNLGMNALVGNASLVKKVAFQRQTLVLAQVIFSLVQFAIEIGILFVVVTALGSPAWRYLWLLPVLMVLLALFGAGIGLALSVIYVYFRDLSYLWTILLQIWFFATPIIYSPELLDGRVSSWIETLVRINPMFVFTDSFRLILFHGSMPSGWRFAELLGVTLVSLLIGLRVFRRMSRRLAEEL
jgi:ABC-type polysaccharide/polyol phosphate export permease